MVKNDLTPLILPAVLVVGAVFLFPEIKKGFSGVAGGVGNAGLGLGSGVGNAGLGLGNGLKDLFEGVGGGTKTIIYRSAPAVADAIGDVAGGVGDAVAGIGAGVDETARGLGSFGGAVGNSGADVVTSAGSFASGFIDNLNIFSKASDIGASTSNILFTQASRFAGSIRGFIKGGEATEPEPEKIMEEVLNRRSGRSSNKMRSSNKVVKVSTFKEALTSKERFVKVGDSEAILDTELNQSLTPRSARLRNLFR